MSHKTVYMCSEDVETTRSDKLKVAILDYFDRQPALKDGQITMLSFARETDLADTERIIDQKVNVGIRFSTLFLHQPQCTDKGRHLCWFPKPTYILLS